MSGLQERDLPPVPLAAVEITAELASRTPRARDAAAEAAALITIFQALAEPVATAYRAIVDAALRLCRGGSAGISLVDHQGGEARVYWPALAGAVAEQLRGTVPVECIPCSAALANDSAVLLRDPARHFTVLAGLEPAIAEALVSPLRVDGVPIGTLWIMAHDPAHRFDAEDARLLESLATAAAAVFRQGRAERAHAEALAAQRTLDAIMEHLPEGLTIADAPDVTIRRVSRYGQELTGRPLAQIAGIPADLHPENWDIYYPDGGLVPADRLPLTRATVAGEVVRNEELVLRRPDGAEIAVLCNAGPIRAESGDVVGGLIAWRDVDEYKAALRDASEFEARFRLLADHMSQFAWIANADGWIHWYNRRWFEYTGTTLEEMQGWGWTKVHHPEHVERVVARISRSWETGEPWEDTFPLRSRTGEWRWFLSRALPIRDDQGRVRHWFGTNTDVTEQRAAEQALRASEDRLRLALAAGDLGVWQHDLLADRFTLDERARGAFGLDYAECSTDEWLARVHPDDRARLETAVGAALDPKRKGPVAIEYRVVHPDGSVHWLSILGRVRFDGEGEAERAVLGVGTIQDVTERRALVAALQEADRRKDEFIATLAHELRNPLAPVRNAVRVLATPGTTPAQQQWGREVIERQVGAMARLLDDLLDAARITSGKLELRRESVQVWSVLAMAIETSRPLIDARQHSLNVVLPADPVRIDADPVRLCQIVANLLNNAAKFTPPGGRIQLAASADARQIRIEVRDTGVGLTREALGRVFDLFAQVEESRTHGDGGLGIGLSLVKGLVELHGGRVEAHSAGPGAGALFVVMLPRDGTTSPADVADHGLGRAVTRTSRRVLIADDNRDNADSLAMLLELDGHRVRVAYSGDEALRIARETEPEVALLDIGMPGMDGYELAQHLRELPLARRPLLVAITGWGQEADERRALAAGFDRHLTKPVDPRRIADLL